MSYRMLRESIRQGVISHPMRGVYHCAGLPDTLELRVACLALVVPRDCVVTDRTAAWLWGAESALAPGAHQTVPRRFKGYRGIVQLRGLAPLVDPRSQSPGESIMRLRWLDAGLPVPQCQVEVPRMLREGWERAKTRTWR